MDTDEGLYHAKPQTRGKIAHETVDNKTASNRKDDLLSLPVYSGQYKLMGKVDVYRKREKLFIDRAVRTAFNRKQFSFKDFVFKLRARFSKMLTKNGAIRLQYSVYEVNNTNRVIENLMEKIDQFSAKFNGADSVIVFEVSGVKLKKYGNAIHRDVDVVYF